MSAARESPSDEAQNDDTGTLSNTRPDEIATRPAITDVSAAARDPAERRRSLLPSSSLGQSPTPAIGVAPERAPFLVGDGATGSFRRIGEETFDLGRDTSVDAPPPGLNLPPPDLDLSLPGMDLPPPGLDLPPPNLDALDALPTSELSDPDGVAPDDRPLIRGPDSVVSEAVRSRGPVQAFGHWIGTASQAVRVRLSDTSAVAVRRFERLPRWQQLLCVAAPYLSAFLLVAYLFQLRVAGPSPIVMVPSPPATPSAVGDAPSAKRGPPAEQQPADRAPAIKHHTVQLRRRSSLFIRPNPSATRAARLRRGHVVTVYPDFPSPDGWKLARSSRGTVGFISTRHLEGKPDPAINAARRARKRRRRQER